MGPPDEQPVLLAAGPSLQPCSTLAIISKKVATKRNTGRKERTVVWVACSDHV